MTAKTARVEDAMAISSKPPSAAALTSRRAMLAGLAGGLAATAASLIGRGSPVAAGAPYVQLGDPNSAPDITTIQNTAQNGSAFSASASGTGTGVRGSSSSGRGVHGRASVGVLGESHGGAAVYGFSGDPTSIPSPPAAPKNTAVYANASYEHVTGSPTAVRGDTSGGIALHGTAGATGWALRAQGRVLFSTSGLARVFAGDDTVVIGVGPDLQDDSRVLCTLETNQGGLSIVRVTKNPAANTFKVFLSDPLAANKVAKVAWFVIG